MRRLAHVLLLVVACATLMMVRQHGLGGGKDKLPVRPPTYGGGFVQSPNAVKYGPEILKNQNVPDLITDNKNTLVLKYPGKLLLSASSIWEGWPEALAFDGNPHS